MGVRIELLFLLLLGACWASDSRELLTSDLSTREVGNSNASVLLVNHLESERGVLASEVGKDENFCTLCEEFAGEALNYLAANKTQTEIMIILRKSCSKLQSFKKQCMTLVDYYAPLFFLEISSIQPGDFCRKVNLCEQIVSISQRLSNNSCGFCHRVVADALLKLKDPDTQLEILALLLKGCDAMKNYASQCKSLVFEYGPMILVNAEEFIEAHDICMLLHVCDSPKDSSKQELAMEETSMIATS